MKGIFLQNGVGSLKIINQLAKKEFGNEIGTANSYVELKRDIIKVLRKKTARELEENKLATLVNIKSIEENNFSDFISVRFAYWGMTISIAILMIGNVPINSYFNMTKKTFGTLVATGIIILLVTMSRTIHMQHDELEYLNFKLICFDEIIGNRKKKY